jgi:ABC-type taurine transport system ATPase subunit
MDLSVLTITHEVNEADFLAEEIVIADSPIAVEKNTERLIVLFGSRSWRFLPECGCGKC